MAIPPGKILVRYRQLASQARSAGRKRLERLEPAQN
jgi:hypothetical protein